MSTREVQRLGAPGRSKWVVFPPPALFVLSFVAGLQIQALGWPHVSVSIGAPGHLLGTALLVLAALLLLPAPALFLARRTTIVPHRSARSLVTSGPYRITRNPMYLALATGYVGLALFLNVAWPLVFLSFPIWVLERRVIPFEEANLERLFGSEYQAYRQRVRRWI